MMSEGPRTIFVDTREGPAFADVPADVVTAVLGAAGGDGAVAERALEVSALVLIRAGKEAGEALLRHWIAHAPDLLIRADPAFAQALADTPESIVGPLAGTSALHTT